MLICTNCGRQHDRTLLFQLLEIAIPPDLLAEDEVDDWKCCRCRARADKGLRRYCRTVRDTYGLTQRTWAQLLGVEARSVARWETGTPEPTGKALQLLSELDAASRLNPEVVRFMRAAAQRNVTHHELFSQLLLRAAGGVARPRRRRVGSTRVDGLVVLQIRLTPEERRHAAVNAYSRGKTMSDWLRSLLAQGGQQDSTPKVEPTH